MAQACLTKFFVSSNPDENYYHYVFEREAAKEKKLLEEREAKLKLLREEERKKKALLKKEAKERREQRLQEQKEAREEALRQKYEGIEILPGLYLGNRLVAMNSEWLQKHVRFVLNCTREVSNYYEGVGFEEDSLSAEGSNGDDSTTDVIDVRMEEVEGDAESSRTEDVNTSMPAKSDKLGECENEVEGVFYHRISISDDSEENLLMALHDGIEFIDTALSFPLVGQPHPLPNRSPSETDSLEENPLHNDIHEDSEPCKANASPSGQRGGILVHCKEGMSRSPSVVIAYLMLRNHSSLSDAIASLCNGRLTGAPPADDQPEGTTVSTGEIDGTVSEYRYAPRLNEGFKRQLMALESRIAASRQVSLGDSTVDKLPACCTCWLMSDDYPSFKGGMLLTGSCECDCHTFALCTMNFFEKEKRKARVKSRRRLQEQQELDEEIGKQLRKRGNSSSSLKKSRSSLKKKSSRPSKTPSALAESLSNVTLLSSSNEERNNDSQAQENSVMTESSEPTPTEIRKGSSSPALHHQPILSDTVSTSADATMEEVSEEKENLGLGGTIPNSEDSKIVESSSEKSLPSPGEKKKRLSRSNSGKSAKKLRKSSSQSNTLMNYFMTPK